MKDYKKIVDQWSKKMIHIKSEDEARILFEELKPHLTEFQRLLEDDRNTQGDDVGNDEIDWIGEIQEYISATIKLYLDYHVQGKLEGIQLSIYEDNPPDIAVVIDGKLYNIDFEEFKNGTDDHNREMHRECYFRNQSIWNEFVRFNSEINFDIVGEGLCEAMKSLFPSARIEFYVENKA